jgi:hypothetical protein
MPEVRRLEERVRELERLAGLHRLGDDGQVLLPSGSGVDEQRQ